MSRLYCNLPDLLEATMPPDPELAELIEPAYLDCPIDGQTGDLAYAWKMANRPELCEMLPTVLPNKKRVTA